jgi:hypothetical protein
MKPPDPMVVGVNQPSLTHSSFVLEFISSSHGPLVQVKEQKLKKRVFQQPIGNENAPRGLLPLGSCRSINGVLLLLFLEQPFLEQ